MQLSSESFFQLIRLSIGKAEQLTLPEGVNWKDVEVMVGRQGLSAIMVDGIERLSEEDRPPRSILLKWIGETLHSYEIRYEKYRHSIAEMATFFNARGLKMMVLKGYACSLDWPKPQHRPAGDIDIWLFGKNSEAEEVLRKEKGLPIDNSHHHHTVFFWRGFMVENHYDFVNVYAHKSSRELEKVFKRLGEDDTHFVELDGEIVYLPSPNLHALFLIRHLASHFVGSCITLRQILDWAFFVQKHTGEIDWHWLTAILDEYHMTDFYNCINAICVENLGFAADNFPSVQFLPSLKDQVLKDILSPEFSDEEPRGLMKRVVFKWRRWRANAWKQKLCFNESRWSAFWHGVWAKVLKPAGI